MSVLVPERGLSKGSRDRLNRADVFYNPVMEFNRDISVLAVESYQRCVSRNLKILDAMTGCGIRGIRYAVEVNKVAHVVLSDVQHTAIELAKRNIERNGVEDRVEAACMDANLVLTLHNTPHDRFDVVDLDPFGSPAPFLDSAIRGASNNALVLLTATDMPPLCGIRPNAALRKYGGRPLRTEYCHEVAVRLLVASLVSASARHDMGIEVKLTHSTDHYVRIYVTVRHGATRANESLGRLGYLAHCFHCSYRELSNKVTTIGSNCKVCGGRYAFAGPLWIGNLYDKKFCDLMLDLVDSKRLGKKNRVIHSLKKIIDEIECPTYYRIDRLSDRHQTRTPKPERVVEEVQKMGYLASLTHFHGYGIRTDAGPKILEQILRNLSQKTSA